MAVIFLSIFLSVSLPIVSRPTTTASLIKIDGFSERMCERFGDKIVDFVKKFCSDHNLSSDKFSPVQVKNKPFFYCSKCNL